MWKCYLLQDIKTKQYVSSAYELEWATDVSYAEEFTDEGSVYEFLTRNNYALENCHLQMITVIGIRSY